MWAAIHRPDGLGQCLNVSLRTPNFTEGGMPYSYLARHCDEQTCWRLWYNCHWHAQEVVRKRNYQSLLNQESWKWLCQQLSLLLPESKLLFWREHIHFCVFIVCAHLIAYAVYSFSPLISYILFLIFNDNILSFYVHMEPLFPNKPFNWQ